MVRNHHRQKISLALAGVAGLCMACIMRAMPVSMSASKRVFCASPPVAVCLPWCLEIADTVALLPDDAPTHITIENVVIDAGRMTLNYTVPV